VCPVDCFHEGHNFIAIDPDECIDCGVCVPECPVNAIVHEEDIEKSERDYWYTINREISNKFPNIKNKKNSYVYAEHWINVPNKRVWIKKR
jgi:ferredoxin